MIRQIEENGNLFLMTVGGEAIFSYNLHKQDIPILGISNPFVREVLETWVKLHFSDVATINSENIGDQIIWYNSLIRINDRPFFYKHWSSHGISKISHLQAENGTLLRYDELRTAFQELKWLEFYGVLSSVKTFMRKLHSTPMRANETVKGVTLTELISKHKVNNFIYTSLLKKKTPPSIRSQEKWRRDLRGHNDCDVNWKIAYTIAFNCTLSTKLRTFHFKFLHRRIVTNDFLKKINLVQSDKCCFCEQETETIIHLFLHCYITQGFWNDVKQLSFNCL